MQTILNFLIKHNHWFLFLLLEGISLVLIISFNNYQGAVAFTSANGIAGNIYSAMSDINGYFGLKEENSALTAQNNSLMNEIDELKEELRSYRDSTLLSGNSFADKGNFSYSTARVVNNSLNKVNNYITIDKGSSHGIETEMGVFNEKGVVGIVYQTSDNFSIVIPLLNSKSRISCRLNGSASSCPLQRSGGDPQHAPLIDLPRYTVIEKGDTVVTSGYSSIFPAELPVGVIEEIKGSDDGLFYRAKTRLFTDFSTINNVYIVGNRNKDEQTALEKSIEKE